jgi:leucyl aminopeptidase
VINYTAKAIYTFDKYKTTTKRNKADDSISVCKVIDTSSNEKLRTSLRKFVKVINAANITRDLENEPANMMSPQTFSNQVKKLFQDNQNVKVHVKNEKEMREEGLNLVLAVGLSSKRLPRFITIELIKDKDYPTICLIGKTVVYDAGGLNIKVRGMNPSMKTDKSGGSVVVGIMKYFSENHLKDFKYNIVGILPVVENLLSENVTRPGDIMKSYSGKSVEITDTDAEGRLIMADAISYSKKYKPTLLCDFATLTGWAETVHMDLSAVCYCRNMELAAKVNSAGERMGERVWFLPKWDEYMEYIKSNVANVRNFNMDMSEGAYLPSMFLLSFVPLELRDSYVHFDICNNFEKNLARGNCVALAVDFLKSLNVNTA